MSDLKEIWESIIQFNNRFFPGWREVDEVYYSNAIAGEAGEVCSLIKKRVGGGTKPLIKVNDFEVLEEMADIFIYMALLSERMGFNCLELNHAIKDKIDKNRERMKQRACFEAAAARADRPFPKGK